jgi:hypothetical protein
LISDKYLIATIRRQRLHMVPRKGRH